MDHSLLIHSPTEGHFLVTSMFGSFGVKLLETSMCVFLCGTFSIQWPLGHTLKECGYFLKQSKHFPKCLDQHVLLQPVSDNSCTPCLWQQLGLSVFGVLADLRVCNGIPWFLVCSFPLTGDRGQIFVRFFAVFSVTLLEFFVHLHTSCLSDMHSVSIFFCSCGFSSSLKELILFYVHGHFAHLYVCAPCAFLVPTEARKGC